MSLADWFLSPDERANAHTQIDAAHPGLGWTTGNTVRPIVHGATYFRELHERISALGAGDRLYFVDWRGDPDEQLTDHPDETVGATFAAAARRGVEVRGLLWRSHWRRFGFHSREAFEFYQVLAEAGGQCLRDMRTRTGGAHHQKFVLLRHRDDPTRDVAYLGGIDLCHSRRDTAEHDGDPQPLPIAAVYGPTPAWHDVQVAISGPAVHDVETTFRERWEDSLPLTLNPGRRLTSWVQGEQQVADPLGPQWPPPPVAPGPGTAGVQIARTYPPLLPVGHTFAPDGERSIALGNTKAVARAQRLIYVEDQYFWSDEVGTHFATALRNNPQLRLVVVLPSVPDLEAVVTQKTQLYARKLAMDKVIEAAPDRVAFFSPSNPRGLPVYVHSKVCVIDDRWASVGSDNLNRRSWSSDSEAACFVVDERADDLYDAARPAPADAFPVVLLRELVAEHVGLAADELPTDLHEIFDLMVESARELDDWYAGLEAGPRTGWRSLPGRAWAHSRRVKGHREARQRQRVLAGRQAVQVEAAARGRAPAGRLRRLDPPVLTDAQQRWAPMVYAMIDPDGTVLREEDLGEMVVPE